METIITQPVQQVSHSRYVLLQSRIRGTVITPLEVDYENSRQAWNLSVDQHPAVIVVADAVEDIIEAVKFAIHEDLNISVQSTGHGVVFPANNTLLIKTSGMKNILVDSDSRTALIEAGAKWGEVLEKTQAVGLAPLLGSSPDVGAVGYTLGGGFGWLGRKYGLAADSVRFFEMVTSEGDLIRASLEENSDLFWGLKGGGGGFGIITRMEINLYPVSTVYGGNLIYPVEDAREVFLRYRDWIASVPDEMTSSIVLMNFPPIPLVPEVMRGKSFVMVRGCHSGSIRAAESMVNQWRKWRPPFIDDFKAMPFSQVAGISNDPVDPLPRRSTGAWLKELSDEAIDIMIRASIPAGGNGSLICTEVRHAGGAISRGNAETSAYGNRDATLLFQMVGMTPTQEIQGQFMQFANQVKQQLKPYLTGGVYMNFIEGEESQQMVQSGFSPEAYHRLRSLKTGYDPHHRLRSGFKL